MSPHTQKASPARTSGVAGAVDLRISWLGRINFADCKRIIPGSPI